jgi:Icc-related predicted phosphoesterase
VIIDCIGCLHGHHPKLEGGDLLIVTGDLTSRHTPLQTVEFLYWLSQQEYRKIIWIAGNHDTQLVEKGDYEVFFDGKIFNLEWPKNTEYLCNSGTEFEGLKIWGTPNSLLFDGVNPKCTAFMGTEEELKKEYDKIANDIDILISHTPPHGILDKNIHGEHCGSKSLRRIMGRVKPKLWVFSHIHEAYGEYKDKTISGVDYHFINCSYVNERYKPVNKVMRIVL